MRRILLALSAAAVLSLSAQAQQQLQFGPSKSAAPTAGAPHALDAVVAVVEDDVITRAELDQALRTTERQLKARGGELPPPQVLERQVLERQILMALEQRAAQQQGIRVDDQSLNAALESIANRNHLTLGQLRQAIEKDGFSFAEYQEQIRREMVATLLRQKMVDSRIQVSDAEVEAALGGQQADPQQRDAVRQGLFKRKVDEEWEQWLRRLRDEAYVEIRL